MKLVCSQKSAQSIFTNKGLESLIEVLSHFAFSRKWHYYAIHNEVLLTRISLNLQLFLVHIWRKLPHPVPSQTSNILRDFPANIPASKNHKRSDNPCVQPQLTVRFGKKRMGKLPCEKKTSKALQKYTKPRTRKKKKNFSMFWITVCFIFWSSQNS